MLVHPQFDPIVLQLGPLAVRWYGEFRFSVDYTREPDSYLGLLAFGLSMGQWLSLPMIATGVALLAWSHRIAPGRPA